MSLQQKIDTLLTDAIVRYDRGEPEEARRICREVLAINPNESGALHLSGLIANDEGDQRTAAQLLEQAVRVCPNDPDAWNDFGNVLQLCGQIQEALVAFGQAARLAPTFADAHSNYGYMLFRQRAFEESLTHFRRAIEIDPGFILACNNLGSALLELGRRDEAVEVFRSAIARDSNCVDSYINLGNALRHTERHIEAIDVLQRGLKLPPVRAELFLNLGGCHKDLGQFTEAQVAYEQAIALQCGYAEAHWNRSLLMLAQGDYARGWEEFEWRRKVPGIAPDVYPRNSPEWTGQLITGKTLLLVAEQGLGDTLQFIRYAESVQKNGARVIAAVQHELLGILAGCPGVDQFIPLRPPFPPHDLFCFLMSLPRLLSPSVEFIPNTVPYLNANEPLVSHWRERLAAIPGFKIGIGWQGNPKYAADRYRSMPLRHFELLAQIPGVQLISLQQGYGSEQLPAARERFSILDFGAELDRAAGPFMDTAAIIQNLDLVISCDTVLVHLAGALGVDVWVPTSFVPDWRWLLERSDSPWYPTLRLFHQRERLNWSGVFSNIASELAMKVARISLSSLSIYPPPS